MGTQTLPTPGRAPSGTFSLWGGVGATTAGWGTGGGGHLPTAGGMHAAASGAGKELGRASRRLEGDKLEYGVSLGWKGHREGTILEPSLWGCQQHQDTQGEGWRGKPDLNLQRKVSPGVSRSCSPSPGARADSVLPLK